MSSQTEREIIKEAAERLEQAADWESVARKNYLNDLKFGHADSYNGYQWPEEVSRTRIQTRKPMLTINQVRQQCLQIINDAKQNKVACNVAPVSDAATKEAAEIYEGVIRHIEYQSQAESVYDSATETQVFGGIGYWRIVTDYVHEDTFDQEIFIRRIKDPLSVYLDPGITELDGSDARWGIVFEDLPKTVFESLYPKMKGKTTSQPLNTQNAMLDTKHFVRIAEYFRRSEKRDKLLLMPDGSTVRASKLAGTPLLAKLREEHPDLETREIITHEIEQFKIAGTEIIEKTTWPGKYIPLVRVIGEETIIEGKLDRKGHVRASIDAQRMANYWASAAVEHVALQSKTPYIGPMEAFAGLETYWESANRADAAWLPFKGFTAEGTPIAAPQRQQPPVMAQAYITGMEVAQNQLQVVSGQFQAEMGAPGNERSGTAIQQRQRQGDNATYHYIDHLALAIRYTGRILIDLIPKIYDTERVLKIMAEDGSVQDVTIDPNAPSPHQQSSTSDPNVIKTIFNPNVGRYDVQADVGAAFGTKRQEAFAALSKMIQHSPGLVNVAGDLLMKSADFPLADELAERLKRMVPPQALGGPSPETLQLQQTVQNMHLQMTKMMQDSAEERLGRRSEQEQKQIDAYKAETDRIGAMKAIDPEALRPIIAQLVQEVLTGATPQNVMQPYSDSLMASASS